LIDLFYFILEMNKPEALFVSHLTSQNTQSILACLKTAIEINLTEFIQCMQYVIDHCICRALNVYGFEMTTIKHTEHGRWIQCYALAFVRSFMCMLLISPIDELQAMTLENIISAVMRRLHSIAEKNIKTPKLLECISMIKYTHLYMTIDNPFTYPRVKYIIPVCPYYTPLFVDIKEGLKSYIDKILGARPITASYCYMYDPFYSCVSCNQSHLIAHPIDNPLSVSKVSPVIKKKRKGKKIVSPSSIKKEIDKSTFIADMYDATELDMIVLLEKTNDLCAPDEIKSI